MTRTGTILIGAALALGLATDCGTKEGGGGDAIGLSVLTKTNPFFNEIARAAKDEAKKSGYRVIVTSAEFDPATQRAQVKNFIVQKVNAIILTPADSKAVGTAIREANAAGIPVFTADIASLAEGAKVVSHIATDNYSGGRQAAKAMMQALGNEGKVAIIDHPEVESVILRTKGFRDELKEAGSKIEIVGAWPGKGSKSESLNVAQDVLTAHGDLAGIFAINDPTALGVYAAVEKKGLVGKIVIVGFDGQPEGKEAIRDGKIYADPIQFPDRIGRETVQTIMKYLNGEKVPPEILIPTKLYYKADAEKDPLLKDK
jgi:ribose transport system substrate-binding protein